MQLHPFFGCVVPFDITGHEGHGFGGEHLGFGEHVEFIQAAEEEAHPFFDRLHRLEFGPVPFDIGPKDGRDRACPIGYREGMADPGAIPEGLGFIFEHLAPDRNIPTVVGQAA